MQVTAKETLGKLIELFDDPHGAEKFQAWVEEKTNPIKSPSDTVEEDEEDIYDAVRRNRNEEDELWREVITKIYQKITKYGKEVYTITTEDLKQSFTIKRRQV